MFFRHPTLDDAIILAVDVHRGQWNDKAREPYIQHPFRVMEAVHASETKIIAVLHDAVEDTSLTLRRLRKLGYNRNIVAALDLLTRRDNETYDEFIRRIADSRNRQALIVKLADVADNMNLRRLTEIREEDLKRQLRYEKARKILENALDRW